MLANGIPCTSRAMAQNRESGLHRALICLPKTCPHDASRKLHCLLHVMSPALWVQDKQGNTPIHLCCKMLKKGLPHTKFYFEALHCILSTASSVYTGELYTNWHRSVI